MELLCQVFDFILSHSIIFININFSQELSSSLIQYVLETKQVGSQRKYYLLLKANSLEVMKELVHNRRFQGIISFPKSSSDSYYSKMEIFQKTGQKITIIGGIKMKFLQ